MPASYQQLITAEINRILRDLNKLSPANDLNKEENKTILKRDHVQNELDRTRKELVAANERAMEAEKMVVAARIRFGEKKEDSSSVSSLEHRRQPSDDATLVRKGSMLDALEYDYFPGKGSFRLIKNIVTMY